MNSLHQFLDPADIALEAIFLDPNNPRFTEASWDYIAEANWDKEDVQEAAQRRLVNNFEVEKLRMNMEVNGYLPIDRVIVKRFGVDKYLVLEGNRRICAAKMIGPLALDGSNVSAAVLASIKTIPCLIYTGTDEDAAWVFQGLRHISGVVEWSAFNKAKLLVEQMEKEDLSLTQVGRRFGLTPHGAGQWVRGYCAFNQARESSDYIHEIDERSYPYFQELFGRSSAPLREWMAWNDGEYKFDNKLNLDEFISWIYPRPPSEEATGTTKKGDFELRRVARRDDLRQISQLLLKNSDLFEQFRGGADLEKCFSIALSREYETESDPVADLFVAVENCMRAISNIPYKAMKDPKTSGEIEAALDGLQKAIVGFK